MDRHELEIYLGELDLQAQYALRAAHALQLARLPMVRDDPFYHAHIFLMTTGIIANILKPWPTPEKPIPDPTWRGSQLRILLGIADTSVLGLRGVRNAYEHFEDELRDWSRKSERRNFFDRGGFAPGMIVGLDEVDIMRNVDTSNGDLIFQGKRFPTFRVMEELTNLRVAVSFRLSTLGPVRPDQM